MRNCFAIYHTWPDLRNAEYEVVQRLLTAAKNVGKTVVLIDNAGLIVWSSPELMLRDGTMLQPEIVEFAVSLHFESPRIVDVYTYYALWQPIEFYRDFGYQLSLDKFATHNDVLSCHSDVADNHALNIFAGLGRKPMLPLETLFHMVPEPYLEPHITADSKMFYIGINWERVGRPKGRYHDLLVMLDKRELVQIYGPEEVHGVAPWAGFQTYQGELPFDGASIRSAINAAGICLALSSAAHKNTGIMSNRLFEGLASGAAVIATPNALIDKYFRDVVYVVDDSRGEALLGQQILTTLRDIQLDPDAAAARVRRGQEILRENCSLEGSLTSLFEHNETRQRHHASQALSATSVTAIVVMSAGTVADFGVLVEQFSRQIACVIDLHVVVPDYLARELSNGVRGSIRSLALYPFAFDERTASLDGIKPSPERLGPLIAGILKTIDTPYFALFTQADRLFREHFASLAKAIAATDGAAMACCGSLIRTRDPAGKERCALRNTRVTDSNAMLSANGSDERGRFMFSSTLLNGGFDNLLALLDGEEHRVFALAGTLQGPLAQTGYATHVLDQTAPFSLREPADPLDIQHQYIRDHFMADGRWLERISRGNSIPQSVQASAPGSEIRWDNNRGRSLATKSMPLDTSIAVRAGEKGVDYLVSGFSAPETEAVWLAATRGIIEFALPHRAAAAIEDYEIVLELAGRRANENGRQQHCTFILNQMAIAYAQIPERFTTIRLKMPKDMTRDTSVFRLELVPDHAEPVIDDAGRVVDARDLGLLIRSIAVERELLARLPTLEVGRVYDCVEESEGQRALVKGFYAPESTMTWICGSRADIQFRLDTVPARPVLILKAAGRPARDGTPQSLTVRVNGGEKRAFSITPDPKELRVDLSEETVAGRRVAIGLEAAHAESVFDGDGHIVDPRLLGVSVIAFGLIDEASKVGRAAPAVRRSMPYHVVKSMRRWLRSGGKA